MTEKTNIEALAPVPGQRKILAESYGRYLAEQNFTYKNGSSAKYSIWGHRRGLAGIVLPITSDNEMILIKQYRHGSNRFMYEFPGGSTPEGGDPMETAARELLEETGYTPGEIKSLGNNIWPLATSLDSQIAPLIGLNCRFVKEAQPDPEELVEVVLIRSDDFFKMVSNGTIVDGPTLAITMLAMPILMSIGFIRAK